MSRRNTYVVAWWHTSGSEIPPTMSFSAKPVEGLLRFGDEATVFVDLRDLFTIRQVADHGAVELAVGVFGVEEFLTLLVPLAAGTVGFSVFEAHLHFQLATREIHFPDA